MPDFRSGLAVFVKRYILHKYDQSLLSWTTFAENNIYQCTFTQRDARIRALHGLEILHLAKRTELLVGDLNFERKLGLKDTF